MAGGLFGKPFTINMKCVIFSLICMALFLYKPSFSSDVIKYLTLFVIFVVAYVAMAWYDFYFDCRVLPLERGKYSLTGLFKPPENDEEERKEEENTDETRIKKKNLKKVSGMRHAYMIYFSHILFIVPLIAYVGLKKSKVNKMVYPILVVLAVFTFFYHGGHLIELVNKNKPHSH